MMRDYYKILNVLPSASEEEIKSSYRVLARRYHPDLSAEKESAEKFRLVQEAYETLSNKKKRNEYDKIFSENKAKEFRKKYYAYQTASRMYERRKNSDFSNQAKNYQHIQKMREEALKRKEALKKKEKEENSFFINFIKRIPNYFSSLKEKSEQKKKEVKIFQIDITLADAIFGNTKSFSLKSDEKKIATSLRIPAGTKIGQTFKVNQHGYKIVCVVKNIISPSKYIYMGQDGLTIDLPITFNEAIKGTSLSIPTPYGETEVVVPPNTNSGTKIKLKKKGIKTESNLEDLTVNILVYVPESNLAVGILEKSADIDKYYENQVRNEFINNLKSFRK